VGVAQLVERWIVVPDVAGPSPVTHPCFFKRIVGKTIPNRWLERIPPELKNGKSGKTPVIEGNSSMSKRVPSYRLHKPSGKAVVTINGKDYYLGVHNSKESKLAYARIIGEYKSAWLSYGIEVAKTSMAMVMADYLDFCEQHYSSTRANETLQSIIALRYLADYEDTAACEFGPLKLKAVRNKMLDDVGAVSRRKLSRQYVNKMVDRIRRMFRWATENELVEVSVYTALLTVKGLQFGRTSAPEASPVKPVDDATVDATIGFCTQVVADMIRLQRLTGMRPGEVCTLTPCMIDRSGSIWIYHPPTHKTAWRGIERSIYLGPLAQAIISPYLNRDADQALFSPAESDQQRRAKLRAQRTTPLNSGNRVGTNRTKKPLRSPGSSYTTQSYGKAIMYACSRVWPIPNGLDAKAQADWRARYWWSPNQLRHAAATKIRQQHGLEAAQAILGHSRASTTELYAEVDHSRGRAIAAAMG